MLLLRLHQPRRRLVGASLVALLVCWFLLLGGSSRVARAEDSSTTTHPLTTQTQTETGDTTQEDTGHNLTPDEVNQLKAIRDHSIAGADLNQLKALASDKIAQYGPQAITRLEAKSAQKQDTRLYWVALIMIVVIPAVALLIFLLYPLVTRKKLRQRAPNASLKEVYSLYLPQALLVTLVLVVLGSALWGVQFFTGRVLGGVINPQLVLQRQALHYVIDERVSLIDDYTDIMVGLANDIADGDPEKPVMDIILDNALQLKNDPVVATANSIIQFVMPFLNYISLLSFLILLLLFLVRIRPDLVRLLQYPVAILEADHTGQRLPEFDSVAVGTIPPGENSTLTMRQIGRKLMWNEVKVMACFAGVLLLVAIIMSLALVLFFAPIVALLVENISTAAEYFLYTENSSSTLVATASLLMLFVVECLVLFLVAFIFALVRLQDVIRQRFAGRITNSQTFSFIRQVGLRFGWLMAVVALLGMGLPFVAEKIDDVMYNNPQDANWTLILLAVPVALLVVLNLGLWLLRGFRMVGRLFTRSAVKEFNLNLDKKAEPVAV